MEAVSSISKSHRNCEMTHSRSHSSHGEFYQMAVFFCLGKMSVILCIYTAPFSSFPGSFHICHVCSAKVAMFSRHLHSWCLQRSTQTSGEEHCCFLQASEEQPLETPCEVTTCSLSEGCSRPRGTACPLNLKSLIHPGWENGDRRLKQATKHTALYLTLNLKA